MRDPLRLAGALVVALSLSCAAGSEEGALPPSPSSDGAIADASAAETSGGDASTDSPGIIPADTSVAETVSPMTDGEVGDGGVPLCATSETCGNGLDDDCNGKVDDGCPCQPGRVGPCFRGPPSARGVGLCADGTMTCFGSGEFGSWGECTGDVVPVAEACDPGGVDENCNGSKNEGCECSVGAPAVPCGIDVGACKKGTQSCVDGKLGPCVGGIEPTAETCNGVDDDCDGPVDEDLVRLCGKDVGACKQGTETCAAGTWGGCVGVIDPAVETCNKVDDDCDGMVDEGVTEPCGSNVGACKQGVRKCTAGSFGLCEGATLATAEECNNVDDDCDGLVDEGLKRACGSSVGICRTGTETCAAGNWGTCVGGASAGIETCDGTLDENCNGTVDEGCGCVAGTVRKCGSTVGQCRQGDQTCKTDGTWGDCVGETKPIAELCNGLNDDCDAETDEGCDCITGTMRACGSLVGACKQGKETCDAFGKWGPCLGGVQPSSETCNAIDDDCDGPVDEGDVCPKFPPTVICPGSMSGNVGAALALSGGGSDPDGGAVTFTWSVATRPVGSTANPTPANSASTSFTPDTAGTYVLKLCVKDDEAVESCCTATITASSPCTAPTNPGATTCGTSWDRRPIVEFTPIPTGITYTVFEQGNATPLATLTDVGRNYYRPATAIGAGSAPPGTAVTMYVRACRTSDPTCCTTSSLVTASLVESCTTPVAPTTSNVMFSEYLIDGDGGACPGDDCEAGEAIEITNLSPCPIKLDGYHFSYANSTGGAVRSMNFGATDIIPPRGVYVAIRNITKSKCTFPFILTTDDPALFGQKTSTLAMQGASLASGWFNNTGGGSSQLRIASGAYTSLTDGSTIALIAPYKTPADNCISTGFNAINACGDVASGTIPSANLNPNQLGRLWHPCDSVVNPMPSSCK